MKNKVLFVIESLTLAGSEKSIIALLSNLNPASYEIDLQLISFGGELEKFLPEYVNILPALPYPTFAAQSWLTNINRIFSKGSFNYFKTKVVFSLNLRTRERNHPEIAQLYWECVQNAFRVQQKEYDVAIAYAHGVPTFYVIDKVKAKKKITWVNANMEFSKKNKYYQKKYYPQFDAIVPVTEATKKHFISIFPNLAFKCRVIPDMVDYKSIQKMADIFSPMMKKDEFNILTVARLEKGMKGLDIAIEVAKILKERGVDFHWYFLGQGSFKTEMELYINLNMLQKNVTLLGTATNPYPFFKAADLYVQTSRSESYGISIAEARLLNIPIVTTRFDNVNVQMIHGKNGLVTDMNPKAVAEEILKIKSDKVLYNSIVEYLKQEPKENTVTIYRFNTMINQLLSKSYYK